MDILLEYGTEVNKPGGAIELILTKKNRDELISSIKNVKIPEVSDSYSGEVSDTIPVDFRTLVLAS
ncbi:MAG: hypothetical protein HQ562_02575 [Candidatus Marinimicrobia bacterium]|nr:hypothetical protein [Candidatus Neomarinimicrobiota bacterium]